jgi:hypothetical protein
LLNYGWKAGFSIIADLIGTGGYLTESQLSLLYKAGNDLVPHGQYALSSYATPELAIADIDYNSTYLTSRGYTRVAPVYVYPNGVQHFSSAYPSQIKQHLESSGYEAAFLASGYLNGAIGGIGKFDIPRYAINASVNTATAIEYLNLAVASRQSMTFMLHSIVASGASGDHANRADVVAIMDAVKALELAGKCYVLSPCRAALELKNSWNEYGYSAF